MSTNPNPNPTPTPTPNPNPTSNPPKTLRKVKSRKEGLNKLINSQTQGQDATDVPPVPSIPSIPPLPPIFHIPKTPSTEYYTPQPQSTLHQLNLHQPQPRSTTTNTNTNTNTATNTTPHPSSLVVTRRLKNRGSSVNLRGEGGGGRSRLGVQAKLGVQTPSSGSGSNSGSTFGSAYRTTTIRTTQQHHPFNLAEIQGGRLVGRDGRFDGRPSSISTLSSTSGWTTGSSGYVSRFGYHNHNNNENDNEKHIISNSTDGLKDIDQRGRQLRFEQEVPIMPDAGLFHMNDRIESAARRILAKARLVLDDDDNDKSHWGHGIGLGLGLGRTAQNPLLVPAFRWAVPFSPHPSERAMDMDGQGVGGWEEDLDGRPKGFFLPIGLNQLDRDMITKGEDDLAGWVKEMTRYPREKRGEEGKQEIRSEFDDRPDLFSRAHHLAAQSNGTLMIVTMYRSPDSTDSLTDVYVTPGMSVDCAQLGEAALEFKDKFDHLLSPQQWWMTTGKGNRNGYTREQERVVVDPLDPQQGWQRGEAERDRSSVEVVFHGRPATVTGLVAPSQRPRAQAAVIENVDLNQIVSFLIGSNPGGVTHQLSGKSNHEVFERYQARFHTHEPASVHLYEGTSDANDRTGGRDAGHDMRYVTGITGGLAATFVYKLNPDNGQVSSTVHTSWQFWPLHRYPLMKINESVYKAIRPALILGEVVKRGIHDEGWCLPAGLVFQPDTSPQMPDTEFVRRDFIDQISSKVVWKNYPSHLDCRAQRAAAIDYMAGPSYTADPDTMKTPNRPIPAPLSPRSDSSSPSPPQKLGDYLRSPDGKVFSFVR